jgi:broad specificity phosphatase PhoE
MRGVLILVRHRRTAENAAGLLLGRLDTPLDEVGEEQAERLAKAIETPARVVSSPLLRARQTAAHFGPPVEVDDRWIEIDYGDLDGQPIREVGPKVWDRWRDDPTYIPAGGESLAHMQRRIEAVCAALAPDAAERDVVVVSHVSPIKAAIAWVLGTGPEVAWRSHLDQASISRIWFGPRGGVLRSFNETAHLGPEGLGSVRITG